MAEVARARVGIATHLTPPGPLDQSSSVAELRKALATAVASGEYQLVIDLTGAPVICGEALEGVLDTLDELARLGGELRLVNPSPAVRDVLRVTGLLHLLAAARGDPRREPGTPVPAGQPRRIGEILVARGLVTEANIAEAIALHRQRDCRMAEILLEKGWLAERDLMDALGEQLGLPVLRLRPGVYDPAAIALLDPEIARRLCVAPLFRVRGELYLATADPQSVPSIDAVEDLTGLKVRPVLACTEDVLRAIAEARAAGADLTQYLGELESDLELVEGREIGDEAAIDQMAAGSPVINLINGLIQRAVRDGASDIHIEAGRKNCRIRLRVDGVLYTAMTPPMDVHPALVSRLKVMASLDIAERRLPQDGRIQVVTAGRTIDLRFSSLPGVQGEKVVLRVLDKSRALLDVERLGMSEIDRERFKELLRRSHGLILVTGPTGSGKTTSLYAALSLLNSSEKNVITIEDPVEYQIDTINQNQVREAVGLSFARILKHVLRQDPDVVMVGEIRERETAETAVQASLTGHLVLSTLHTNDSIGAITRLLEMGIEPYLLSSALVGLIAQRLVRTICAQCRTTQVVPAALFARFGRELEGNVQVARGRGCSACYDSGYRGRIALYELIEIDPDLQRLIMSSPSRDQLDAYLKEHGVRRLVDDGLDHVLACETTLDEILRVVSG